MTNKTKTVAASPLVLIEGTSELTKAVVSYGKRANLLDKDAHLLAVSIVAHSHKHREVSLVNLMIDKMPKSARKNAMRDFFANFAPVAYNEKEKTFVFNRAKFDVATLVAEAEAKPFYTFRPEPAYKPLDLSIAIARLIKQAESRMEAGLQEGDNVDYTMLEKLRAIATPIEEEEAPQVAAKASKKTA